MLDLVQIMNPYVLRTLSPSTEAVNVVNHFLRSYESVTYDGRNQQSISVESDGSSPNENFNFQTRTLTNKLQEVIMVTSEITARK